MILNHSTITRRLPELDVIRGIAILCILLLNIRIFALGVYAYAIPLHIGTPHWIDSWVFYCIDIFFNGKFISIFCLLFGMTIMILMNHYDDSVRIWSLSKRMISLCVIGLIHGYLLFSGDILFSYGICGMIAMCCYSLSAKNLMALGSSIYIIAFFIHLYVFFYVNSSDAVWHAPTSVSTTLTQGYLGSFWDQIKIRAPSTFYVQTTLFIQDYAWRTLGLILVGMGIYKQGLLFRALRWTTLLTLSVICIGLSTLITLYNIHWQWNAHETQFIGLPFLYVVSYPQAILYMLLLVKVYQRFSQLRIFTWLSAVGKMSLTVYLLESLFADVMVTGTGLKLYGKLSYAAQLPIVVCIWMIIILFAHIWMQRFQRGPIESMLHRSSSHSQAC